MERFDLDFSLVKATRRCCWDLMHLFKFHDNWFHHFYFQTNSVGIPRVSIALWREMRKPSSPCQILVLTESTILCSAMQPNNPCPCGIPVFDLMLLWLWSSPSARVAADLVYFIACDDFNGVKFNWLRSCLEKTGFEPTVKIYYIAYIICAIIY